MIQDDHEKLRDDVTEILLANGSFYRTSPRDKNLYWLDAVVIGQFAYEIIQFAANVFGAAIPLVAGSRWVYKKYFGDSASQEPPGQSDEQPSTLPPQLGDVELRGRLEQLRVNVRDPGVRQQLLDDLKGILQYHGWPTSEAITDSQTILTALVDHDRAQPDGKPVS